MFDFKEKFKDRPTSELLQMLEQPEKYQPDAIEAAKTIIENRKEKDPKSFEEDVAFLKIKEHQTISRKEIPAKKTIDIWEEDDIDKSNKSITRNHILAILIVYIAMNCLYLFQLLQIRLNGYSEDYEIMQLVPILAQFAFAITGSIFFFKREKTGWILIVFDFTFRTIFSLQLLVLSLRYISNPFIPFSFYNTILPLILFGLVLFRLGSARLMSEYKATKQTYMFTIGASILFAACIVFVQRFFY
ncbi:hypothetical protein F0919_03980 [Taibaiella lutea]|uniref:Uncharacterized protein n=1 Tax=Taibaiella lutea TaxID=2608001 RepID=A0A5M6CUH3_9BACT|nr:hypothetical protein [Taibaiella lutea]KAA5536839.1 hypothetical protein F0919_03980 [Taibaiella lutea]